MSHLRPAFEKELRFRLTQKTKSNQAEDAILLKNFRYFDLAGSGTVNREQFFQTFIKLGVNGVDKAVNKQRFEVNLNQDSYKLFDIYDVNKKGALDYKEFISMIFGNSSAYTRRFSPDKNSSRPSVKDEEYILLFLRIIRTFNSVENLKDRLYERGITGLIGIAYQFKKADVKREGHLNFETFTAVLSNYELGLSQGDIERIFVYYDKEAINAVNYELIIADIKGKLNPFRHSIVSQVWDRLDQNKQNSLTIDDLKSWFDAQNHPDVLTKVCQPADVQAEFYDSLQAFVLYKEIKDNRLDGEAFQEYYSFVGFAISNDDFFAGLLNNVWKEVHSKKFEQNKRALSNREKDPVLADPHQLRYHVNLLLGRLRQRLALRGPRGFAGLLRNFINVDENQNGHLKYGAFLKALRDFKVDITDQDFKYIHIYFDPENRGLIDYVPVFRGVVGELSEWRQGLLALVYSQLDPNNEGKIYNKQFRGIISNSRNHPDVRVAKKNEQQIAEEYYEVLNFIHSIGKDPKSEYFTKEEITEFLMYLSGAFEDDSMFEQVIIHTFKLRFETKYTNEVAGQAGGRKDYTPNTGFIYNMHKSILSGSSVTGTAPFGTTDTNDSVSKPNTCFSEKDLTYKSSFKGSPEKKRNQNIEPRPSEKSQPNNEYDISIAKAVFSNFRQKLAARGVRGYFAIAKQLHNLDDQGTGLIDIKAFYKGLRDIRLELSESDGRKIFDLFDLVRDGQVAYDDLLRVATGDLNEFRVNLISNIFHKIDVSKQGLILEDLKNCFVAKTHPDARFGKKKADDVLIEFFDTFEIHHLLTTGDASGKDQKVSLNEFIEYYRIVSNTVPDDKDFEYLLVNCWAAPRLNSAQPNFGRKNLNFYQ